MATANVKTVSTALLVHYRRQWLPNNEWPDSRSARWRGRWLWRERLWENEGCRTTWKTPCEMSTTGPRS